MFSFDDLCLVLMIYVYVMLAGLVHAEILVISFVRVHNSAQLAGDNRNTRRMLYRGPVALLHGTTYAVCSPVLLIRGVLHVFRCVLLCWHLVFSWLVTVRMRAVSYTRG